MFHYFHTRGLTFVTNKISTTICPVDTRRRFNVCKTSIQRWRGRIDVLQKLKLRRVSIG